MNNSRAKVQKTIFMALNYIGFMVAGIVMARLLFKVEDMRGHELSIPEIIVTLLIGMFLVMWSYIIHICLHECGHTIFGLASGYKFGSLRFGRLILYKSNGKLKLGTYKLGGTAGQALMLPPEGDKYNFPTLLYNLGGLIVNVILVIISAVLIPVASNAYMNTFLVGSVVMGITLIITNGIPFSVIGNDGFNTILFQKSAAARKCFYDTLIITSMFADGKSIAEIPEEYLTFDWDTKLEDPLICSNACNDIALSEIKRDFEEVNRKVDIVLSSDANINMLHNGSIIGQKIYAMIMLGKSSDEIKDFYDKRKKEIAVIATLLEYQRYMYAYYSLVEEDKAKAAKYLDLFEKSAKTYPYPAIANDEREFIKLVDEKKAACN